MSGTGNETALGIKAELNIGGDVWTLSTLVTTGSGFVFTAVPPKALTLQSAAASLYKHFGPAEAALDANNVPFPAISLKELKVSGLGSETPGSPSGLAFQIALGIGEAGSATKLQFTFANYTKGQDQTPPKYLLAGVRTQDPISLGKSDDPDPVKHLLGAVVLDRLGLFYASENIVSEDVGTLGLFPACGKAQPPNFPKGVSLSARFGMAAAYVDISLSSAGIDLALPGITPPATPQPQPQPQPTPTPTPTTPGQQLAVKPKEGNRYWKELDKTLGPLQLRRIGGEWKDGKLGILLDAALELAGLKVGLSGLAVRFEPSKLNSNFKFSDLEFGLDGLALDLKIPPIAISGALLKSTDKGIVSYSGMASIRAASFTIAAIGSFAMIPRKGGGLEPSFFIYGAFLSVLGGPPCFVVEGIAAGFGYNRAIILPTIDQVQNFPLVQLVLDPSSSTSIVPRLPDSFPPTLGQYFIAAGVKFNSFRLISTFAVVTVQFGARFEIALLGVATLQQPPREITDQAFVVVEMAIRVSFAPDDGLLSAMAVLTSRSFLFHQDCKLTGGFAFFIWFPPTSTGPGIINRAGEFVLTMGGYHPRFPIPDHYPRVPRIGLNWSLPKFGVAIKGEVYFALTPSYIMAGGLLSADFRSGGFHAWFYAYADFLIGWAPLSYSADVGVRIGASYTFDIGEITVTLGFEIGAELHMLGPPFGGTAYVNLGIVAFTIPIGDQTAKKPDPLLWPEFAKNFLPLADDRQTAAPLGAAIASGVVEEVKTMDGATIATFVNPADLFLTVESLVPATSLDKAPAWQTPTAPSSWMSAAQLGIRPMQKTALDFRLAIEIWHVTNDVPIKPVSESFRSRAIIKNMPKALWSPEEYKPSNFDAEPIKNCLVGLEVRPQIPSPLTSMTALIAVVAAPEITPKRREAWDAKHETQDPGATPREFDKVQSILKDRAEARKAAIEAVPSALLDLQDFQDMGDNPVHLVSLTAMPWQVRMGKLLRQAQRG